MPNVTGTRLPSTCNHVTCGYAAAVVPNPAQNDAGAKSRTSTATGKKYMFATQCSNPAATNVAIGGTITATLSTVDRACVVIHTAKHTNALHNTPNANACTNPNDPFCSAIVNAVRPTCPPAAVYCPAANTRPATTSDPTRLPTYTNAHDPSSSRSLIRPRTHPNASCVSPVNNLAPASTTSTSPTLNTVPVNARVTPYGSTTASVAPPVPVVDTTVATTAPNAMNAPAITASTAVDVTCVRTLPGAASTIAPAASAPGTGATPCATAPAPSPPTRPVPPDAAPAPTPRTDPPSPAPTPPAGSTTEEDTPPSTRASDTSCCKDALTTVRIPSTRRTEVHPCTPATVPRRTPDARIIRYRPAPATRSPDRRTPPVPSLPVITLTGPLGSGKTTLLNHLLHHPGTRLGVIVNDVGDISVDAALVAGTVTDLVPLAGGCVCCLPDAGALPQALTALADPRLRLDAVVVEASGLAEPAALARLVRTHATGPLRPGGAVDLVDATAVTPGAATAPHRYTAATLVAVTRADLLPAHRRDAVLQQVRHDVHARNPDVTVVRADHGRLDPHLVLDGAGLDDPEDQLPLRAATLAARAHAHPAPATHPTHHHVRTVTATTTGPVDPARVVDLLEHPPTGTVRLKGVVHVRTTGGTSTWAVHVVGPHVHVERLRTAPTNTPGTLVAIGPDLDPTDAGQTLRHALATPDAPTPARCPGLARLRRHARLARGTTARRPRTTPRP